jgi:nucleolar protein 14
MSRQQDDDLRLQLDNELDSIRGLLFTETPDTLLPLEAATLRTKASDEPLLESVTTAGPSKVPKATASKRDDTFDQYVRELAFDQRAKPKDRTKTEEELALEEKARLEKAERRRVRRMEGAEDYDSEDDAAYNAKGPQQPAGDDLDDGFMPDDTLGALGNGLSEHPPIGSHDDGVVTDEDEEDEEDTDEDEDASGSENDGLHGSEDEDKENMDDEDRDSTASEQQALVAVKRKPARAAPSHRELPYTFECPESHEAFLEIVENIKDSDIPTVIQRIRALHHPSLAEDNKRKLVAFTGVLIDHILYVASPPSSRFNVVSHIIPHLVALTRSYSASSASHFISKLNLMEKNLKRGLSQNALEPDAKTFPGLAELALLRTVGVMWSTSDLTHAVVSPARLLMSSYLGLSRVRTMQDLASGLFLCTLWLQYESLSARFVPEAINFVVNTILHLAPHGFQKAADVPGSFPHPDLNSELCKPLRLSGPKAADDALTSSADLIGILTGSVEIHLAKSQLLLVSLRIMGRFAELYRPMDGYPELFQPILDIITGIKVRKLPESIQVSLQLKFTCRLFR